MSVARLHTALTQLWVLYSYAMALPRTPEEIVQRSCCFGPPIEMNYWANLVSALLILSNSALQLVGVLQLVGIWVRGQLSGGVVLF